MARLGPFELGELLGTGGMGWVYRARHAELGVDVAIKALRTGSAGAVDRLRAEVQAMARLDHPHIARVFDHGVATGGSLGKGTPWFAMELLRSDLSRELGRAPRWEVVAPYVSQLLDALGHAHARGVIHRDLKVSNVMVGRSDDQRPGLKLVDFGIAAIDPTSITRVGTPSAMAPEQWARSLTNIGPWSDVHAVGMLVWRLVTGARPTGDAYGPGIYSRLCDEDFEPFLPRFPVPEGLEPWLRTAMAFRPSERFACCADAHLALVNAGAVTGSLPASWSPLPEEELTGSSEVTTPVVRFEVDIPRPERPAPLPAPIPEAWQAVLPPPASLHLAGVGTSLLAWRQATFVGREEARSQLWRRVRGAVRRQEPVRVELVGPAGVGASALGRWWVQRLSEVSGTVAVHGGTVGALVDAMLQPLGELGSLAGRLQGLERWRVDYRAAIEAVEALDGEAAVGLRVGAALEVMRAVARVRPVAVFLDGPRDELEQLARRSGELEGPVMLVRRGTGAPLPDWESLSVGPMADPEMSQVLDQLLPLEAGLHRELVVAAAGRPGHLRALLLRTVPQLRPGPKGFVGEVEWARADDPGEAIAGLSAADLETLEVGAVAGPEVLRAVWVRASGRGPQVIDALADLLVRTGLATPTPSGVHLSPGCVAYLQERARGGGRDAGHFEATAMALQHLKGDPLVVSRCWEGAGEPERALRQLVSGWRRVVRLHGTRVALSVIARAEELLTRVPEEEALHGMIAVLAMDLRQEVDHIEPGAPAVLQNWAVSKGWFDTACYAARLWAREVTVDQAALNAVYESFDERYLDRCSTSYQARLLAHWYLRLERFADPRRDEVRERAMAAIDGSLAHELVSEERVLIQHLRTWVERAWRGRVGPPASYLAVAEEAVTLSRRFAVSHLCLDLVELGAAQSQLGQRQEADDSFREAARTARWLGLKGAESFATGNRAGLAGMEGDWERAAGLAQRALVGATHPYLRAVLELICAVPLAQAERFEAVMETLERVEAELARVRPIDKEVDAALVAIAEACGDHAKLVAAMAEGMRE